MIKLDKYITLDLKAIKSSNLTDRFELDDLKRIGEVVFAGYDADNTSRIPWESRNEAAMNLALQTKEVKTYPWPNCSNVCFPLVTVAVQQFHARAYPILINGTDVVKYRVLSDDPSGTQSIRADLIGDYMSYQVLEETPSWEEQHDMLIINLCVVGTAFIKTYRDVINNRNISEFVNAKDLVINYWAKSLEHCDRKTQIITLSRNEVYERVMRGVFRDVLDEQWYKNSFGMGDSGIDQSDMRIGISPGVNDDATRLIFLEQHCSLDLDGDGYAEPYIITIEKTTHEVFRIVTRFDREEDILRVHEGAHKGEIISIHPMEYFTKYTFIPSPDGGIYGIGFGTLMGPLNEAVNSLINQLIDSGTMANCSGGFLGRGAKIRGGSYTFSPFEWVRVDSTGDDLHKSIVPLPVREPSNVLLQLLSLLVDFTNRISGSTEMMVGENPGQNTPAETSRTMVEQGSKIHNAIFKRIWRSLKEEFIKLYTLNSIYMPVQVSFGSDDRKVSRADFLGDPTQVAPVADPNIMSKEERVRQAILLKQASMGTPGYDKEQIEHRFLEALNIEGIPIIFPGPKKTGPLPNPKLQIEQLKAQEKQMKLKSDTLMFMAELEEKRRLNSALIMELHARSINEMNQADATKASTELAHMEQLLNVLKSHDQSVGRMMKLLQDRMQNGNDSGSGVQRMDDQSSNKESPQDVQNMG